MGNNLISNPIRGYQLRPFQKVQVFGIIIADHFTNISEFTTFF